VSLTYLKIIALLNRGRVETTVLTSGGKIPSPMPSPPDALRTVEIARSISVVKTSSQSSDLRPTCDSTNSTNHPSPANVGSPTTQPDMLPITTVTSISTWPTSLIEPVMTPNTDNTTTKSPISQSSFPGLHAEDSSQFSFETPQSAICNHTIDESMDLSLFDSTLFSKPLNDENCMCYGCI